MTQPIPLPPGSGDVTLARSDLGQLISELNDHRTPASPEAVLRVLAGVRAAVERMLPELNYYQVSALNSYLRALSEPLWAAERERYPWKREAEAEEAE